jgi:hypothetical protein
MNRIYFSVAALGAALALTGCNETSGGAMAGPVASAPVAPAAYSLPANAACSGEIERYHTIVKSDLDTGNVEQKVYSDIEADLSRAAAACSAGNGPKAHALVASSKARHGYRA